MSSEKEFAVPQHEVDKLKDTAYSASKVVFAILSLVVIGMVGFALYWTKVADKNLPITVDVDVEEAR